MKIVQAIARRKFLSSSTPAYRTNTFSGLPKGSYTAPNPVHFHIAHYTQAAQSYQPIIVKVPSLKGHFAKASGMYQSKHQPQVTINIANTHSISLNLSLKTIQEFIYPFAQALHLLKGPEASKSCQTSHLPQQSYRKSNELFTPLLQRTSTVSVNTTYQKEEKNLTRQIASVERKILERLHDDIMSITLDDTDNDVSEELSQSDENLCSNSSRDEDKHEPFATSNGLSQNNDENNKDAVMNNCVNAKVKDIIGNCEQLSDCYNNLNIVLDNDYKNTSVEVLLDGIANLFNTDSSETKESVELIESNSIDNINSKAIENVEINYELDTNDVVTEYKGFANTEHNTEKLEINIATSAILITSEAVEDNNKNDLETAEIFENIEVERSHLLSTEINVRNEENIVMDIHNNNFNQLNENIVIIEREENFDLICNNCDVVQEVTRVNSNLFNDKNLLQGEKVNNDLIETEDEVQNSETTILDNLKSLYENIQEEHLKEHKHECENTENLSKTNIIGNSLLNNEDTGRGRKSEFENIQNATQMEVLTEISVLPTESENEMTKAQNDIEAVNENPEFENKNLAEFEKEHQILESLGEKENLSKKDCENDETSNENINKFDSIEKENIIERLDESKEQDTGFLTKKVNYIEATANDENIIDDENNINLELLFESICSKNSFLKRDNNVNNAEIEITKALTLASSKLNNAENIIEEMENETNSDNFDNLDLLHESDGLKANENDKFDNVLSEQESENTKIPTESENISTFESEPENASANFDQKSKLNEKSINSNTSHQTYTINSNSDSSKLTYTVSDVNDDFDDISGENAMKYTGDDCLTPEIKEVVNRMVELLTGYLQEQSYKIKELILFPELIQDEKNASHLCQRLQELYSEYKVNNLQMISEQKSAMRVSIYLQVTEQLKMSCFDTENDEQIKKDKMFSIAEYTSEMLDMFFNNCVSPNFTQDDVFNENSTFSSSTPDHSDNIAENTEIMSFKAKSGDDSKSEMYWFSVNKSPNVNISQEPKNIVNVDEIPLKHPSEFVDPYDIFRHESDEEIIRQYASNESFNVVDDEIAGSLKENGEICSKKKRSCKAKQSLNFQKDICDVVKENGESDKENLNSSVESLVCVANSVSFLRTANSNSSSFTQKANIFFKPSENHLECENVTQINNSDGDWLGFESAKF